MFISFSFKKSLCIKNTQNIIFFPSIILSIILLLHPPRYFETNFFIKFLIDDLLHLIYYLSRTMPIIYQNPVSLVRQIRQSCSDAGSLSQTWFKKKAFYVLVRVRVNLKNLK